MRVHHRVRFARKEVEAVLERFMYLGLEIFPCGSWRREAPTLGDLDLVVLGKVDGPDLYHQTGAVNLHVGKRVHLTHLIGRRPFRTEIISTDEGHLGGALLRWTGSAQYLHYLRSKAAQRGWRLSERGLFEGDRCLASHDEKTILKVLDEEWKDPPFR